MDLCSCTGRTFLISLQGGLNLAYETYHMRILFFERYVRTLTYSILVYAYPRALPAGVKVGRVRLCRVAGCVIPYVP